MRRIIVHSHRAPRACAASLQQILTAVHSGERVCVVASSRENADAYADKLAGIGVLDIKRGGEFLEIAPCQLH